MAKLVPWNQFLGSLKFQNSGSGFLRNTVPDTGFQRQKKNEFAVDKNLMIHISSKTTTHQKRSAAPQREEPQLFQMKFAGFGSADLMKSDLLRIHGTECDRRFIT
jgi:hypothetical protein